ncbi:MAG: DUF6766 family protein [Nocardioidaceae bacterium]
MTGSRFRAFVRENSLSLFFGVIFLGALVGQAYSGAAEYNDQQVADGFAPVSVAEYVTSASFAVDVVENWQSEFLQLLPLHHRHRVAGPAWLPGVQATRQGGSGHR